MLLLLICFILSDRDVPHHYMEKVHQQDVSDQEALSALQLLTNQVVFLQTSCTTCTPLTCCEAAFNGSTPKFPLPPQKQI